MERVREESMNRGILLFAFNTEQVDYLKMAIATAKRANHFLNLPVSVVTNIDAKHIDYKFDNVITENADKSNVKNNKVWVNKGRYRSFELSPYDETILLDVDYIINSDRLLKIFDVYDDFACHKTIDLLMYPDFPNDKIGPISHDVLWATVVAFKKSKRAEQIFNCLKIFVNINNWCRYNRIVRQCICRCTSIANKIFKLHINVPVEILHPMNQTMHPWHNLSHGSQRSWCVLVR